MKILILIAHANRDRSASHTLAVAAQTVFQSNGHDVRVIDLLAVGFDKLPSFSDYVSFDSNEIYSKVWLSQSELIRWCTHFLTLEHFGSTVFHPFSTPTLIAF
jgi:putative NADPH-quinone reductase